MADPFAERFRDVSHVEELIARLSNEFQSASTDVERAGIGGRMDHLVPKIQSYCPVPARVRLLRSLIDGLGGFWSFDFDLAFANLQQVRSKLQQPAVAAAPATFDVDMEDDVEDDDTPTQSQNLPKVAASSSKKIKVEKGAKKRVTRKQAASSPAVDRKPAASSKAKAPTKSAAAAPAISRSSSKRSREASDDAKGRGKSSKRRHTSEIEEIEDDGEEELAGEGDEDEDIEDAGEESDVDLLNNADSPYTFDPAVDFPHIPPPTRQGSKKLPPTPPGRRPCPPFLVERGHGRGDALGGCDYPRFYNAPFDEVCRFAMANPNDPVEVLEVFPNKSANRRVWYKFVVAIVEDVA
ncbi:hypothetical protein NLI96_g12997 [Meripilus lineatus]|uniref:Uncharacterized protein n=1 Tax=Meripilus lineatus TaxID=2056292 RepID=A0AAD5YBW0_9APHY|nr:hypothetical protein NLI96_g12997 [Physisporinus lineatus]